MKKSRIIIPALAMIAFSVAASITGTVAWFTANRTANVDAGTYAVVKTTANLDCKVSDGVGTSTTDNAAGVTDVVAVEGKLTHGSFDHSAKYIMEPDNTGTKLAAKHSLSASTLADDLLVGETSDGDDIYTAVTFDLEFSMSFGSVSGDIGLYIDLANSVFTPDDSAVASSKNDTAKGFRMAFVYTGSVAANGTTRVWADLEDASNCHYVPNSTAANAALPNPGTSYSGDLIDNSTDANATLGTGYSSSATSMINYLGKFVFQANTTVKLNYTVVCWYEGTDPNIVNSTSAKETVFNDVEVSLAFAALNFTD